MRDPRLSVFGLETQALKLGRSLPASMN